MWVVFQDPTLQFSYKYTGKAEKCGTMFKGSQMGPLPVPVSLCFKKNVIVTCKILSLLCTLDNFHLKNVIVFFWGNQISKWCSFEKKIAIFYLLFTFFSHHGHKGKGTRIPSAHISLRYIHVFCSPY